MKISAEQKIINNFPNKLLNRQYRAIRYKRNQSIVLAGINFGFAAADAAAHKGFMTMFMGSAALFCMKTAEMGTRAMMLLKPEYKAILNRAKSINKLKQK